MLDCPSPQSFSAGVNMDCLPETLIIHQPDDWHVHLRDDLMLSSVLPYTSQHFARAIVMPNLSPPITQLTQAIAYRQRINDAVPTGNQFTPLMTCYLTDSTCPDELEKGFNLQIFTAAKLYPAHATTNSSYGVTDINKIAAPIARMEQLGMPLLIHGEVTDAAVDIFDREARFIDTVLLPMLQQYPQLRVVLEHITTQEAAQFVSGADERIAATITPQHLMFNRNHMLSGGIKPHLYCLPILKRNQHQQALRDVVASGNSRFFLGTDSAPHAKDKKESACGCAGVFNAPTALAAYATVFEELGALAHLDAFCSLNGPHFYRLPINSSKLELVKKPWVVPQQIELTHGNLIPFLAGEQLQWSVGNILNYEPNANPAPALKAALN
jgi:dihydroorotase